MIKKDELFEKKVLYIIQNDDEPILLKVYFCGTDGSKEDIEYIFSSASGLYFSLLEKELYKVFSNEESASNFIIMKKEDSILAKMNRNSKTINKLLSENMILANKLKYVSISIIE